MNHQDQNMQNMQNMQNEYQQQYQQQQYQQQQQQQQQQQYQQQPQINFSNINPQTFDPKVKNQIVNHNIFAAGNGSYKVCLVTNSIKFPYNNAYNPGAINTICKVLVHYKHALDIADSLSDHGIASITANKPIPAIMYPMGKDFIGTNLQSREGIYDENIILRTNYPYVIKRQTDLFSTKEGSKMVVYSNPITIIRDKNYNPLGYDDVFKIGVITMCMDRQKELLTDENENEKNNKTKKNKKKTEKKDAKQFLSSNDMLLLQMYVENVFQAAICGSHNILLLPIFGREFGIPIDDQITIYNLCIMKFGHKFKAIMICVPPYEDKAMFEYLNAQIIKPQEITKDIDMNYMAKNMAKGLQDGINDSEENESSRKENLTKKMASMNEEDRMKMLKKIVKTKRNENIKSNKKRR